MELANFWDQTHPLSKRSDKLYEALVPASGDCTTLQGELIRASTRINYDWYNNGWGCNNWSGAVVFIGKRFEDLPVQPSAEIITKLKKALDAVGIYSHGEPCHIEDERANELVTTIHEIIVQAVIDNPEPIHNASGMFNYQEEEYRGSWDDSDEDGEY